MRKHGPKATDFNSASEDGGSKAEDMDVRGEMAEGNDEEMQELASQTSHMLARDARPDEQAYEPVDPNTILRFPRLRGFPLDDCVRRRIASYFHTNFPRWTFHAWLGYIPEYAERWGKLRIPDGGDCIRCAKVVDPLSPYGKRDSSFVWCTFQKDANENYRNLRPRMVDAFGYGRLDFIIALTLPPSKTFNIQEPELHILAHITKARGAEGNAASKLVSFTQFDCSVILDISSVLSVVGRVFTTGTKALGEWCIIDCSAGMCETVFQPPQHAYEDNG
ncbi:hypothetical protein ACGC1H_006605 [Rhizoctonia solani]